MGDSEQRRAGADGELRAKGFSRFGPRVCCTGALIHSHGHRPPKGAGRVATPRQGMGQQGLPRLERGTTLQRLPFPEIRSRPSDAVPICGPYIRNTKNDAHIATALEILAEGFQFRYGRRDGRRGSKWFPLGTTREDGRLNRLLPHIHRRLSL